MGADRAALETMGLMMWAAAGLLTLQARMQQLGRELTYNQLEITQGKSLAEVWRLARAPCLVR